MRKQVRNGGFYGNNDSFFAWLKLSGPDLELRLDLHFPASVLGLTSVFWMLIF